MTTENEAEVVKGSLPESEAHASASAERADQAGAAGAASSARSAADRGKPAGRSGRALSLFAVLLAFIAAGGAGYLYYRLIYLNPAADMTSQVRSAQAQIETLQGRLVRLSDQQATALAEMQDRQTAAIAASEDALLERLNEVARQGPPEPREWRLAEAQYLLRIANHRLLMERDVSSALRLLQAADQILLELNDFALHSVRARLADEILALERVEGVDVQGLFLRLEALKRTLDDLPLRLPEYLARDEVPAESQDAFWPALKSELQSYLELRRFDGTVRPLLAPEEAVYLELNLRLMLERAQLAALRREQVIYTHSLDTARAWVDDYLDPESRAVQQMRAELDALGTLSLDRPLPDISGSLTALASVLRSPS